MAAKNAALVSQQRLLTERLLLAETAASAAMRKARVDPRSIRQIGGDGGNRTPVQWILPGTYYKLSRLLTLVSAAAADRCVGHQPISLKPALSVSGQQHPDIITPTPSPSG